MSTLITLVERSARTDIVVGRTKSVQLQMGLPYLDDHQLGELKLSFNERVKCGLRMNVVYAGAKC